MSVIAPEKDPQMLAIDNALLRNNDLMVDKFTKIVKGEISTLSNQVSEHNKTVLDQMIQLAQDVGTHGARIAALQATSDIHDEKLKSLKTTIATVGATCGSIGGALGFIVAKLMGN